MNEINIYRFSSIGRPIDPDYPSNLAIAALSLVATLLGIIYQILGGQTWLESTFWGVGLGLGVFFAWAIGREIDPDHDLSAFIGAGLTLVGVFLWGTPSIISILWLMLCVRIINRTVGLPATMLDSLGVLGLGTWLSIQEYWGYGVITSLAFLLDALLPKPNRRQFLFTGIMLIVSALSAYFSAGGIGLMGLSLSTGAVALGVTVVFLPVIFASREIQVECDVTKVPPEPIRVQMGQVIAILGGWIAVVWKGESGLISMLPLWAGALGAALYWLVMTIVDKIGLKSA